MAWRVRLIVGHQCSVTSHCLLSNTGTGRPSRGASSQPGIYSACNLFSLWLLFANATKLLLAAAATQFPAILSTGWRQQTALRWAGLSCPAVAWRQHNLYVAAASQAVIYMRSAFSWHIHEVTGTRLRRTGRWLNGCGIHSRDNTAALPRLVRAVFVCLSVTFVYKTNVIKILSLSGSYTILVHPYQTLWQYSDGSPQLSQQPTDSEDFVIVICQ